MRISDWSSDVCSSDLAALRQIVRASRVPIVADIHFHYRRALEAADAGAACLRINPGNIGSAERVQEVINAAKANGCSMRIGVNAGSLERRSEEHTFELQSLMRISYAVFCLQEKKNTT